MPAPRRPTSLKELATRYWKSLREKPGMICAARMKAPPYTLMYGKAGQAPARANLAGGLGRQLRTPPAQAGQSWNSDNCAEVDAANKILVATKTNFGNTGGIDFYAIDSHGVNRPPCLNCKMWVNRI